MKRTNSIVSLPRKKQCVSREITEQTCLDCVRKNGLNLQFCPMNYRNEKNIVLEAVKNNGLAIVFASDILKKDKTVIIQAVLNDDLAFKYADLSLFQEINYINIDLVCKVVSAKPNTICGFPKWCRKNKKIALCTLSISGYHLDVFSGKLKDDIEVVKCAFKTDKYCFRHASDNIRDNVSIVSEFVKINPFVILYALDKPRNDKNIVKFCILKDGNLLKEASLGIRSDLDMVLLAVRKDFSAYQYATERLKNDRNFWFEVAKIGPLGATHIPEQLKEDSIFMYALMKKQPTVIFGMKSKNITKEMAIEIISQRGEYLEILPKNYRLERQINLIALDQNPMALEFCTEDIRKDYAIVEQVVKKNGETFKFAHNSLQTNKKLMKMAIQTYPLIICDLDHFNDDFELGVALINKKPSYLKHLSENLRNNEELVMMAYKLDPKVKRYASLGLQITHFEK